MINLHYKCMQVKEVKLLIILHMHSAECLNVIASVVKKLHLNVPLYVFVSNTQSLIQATLVQ
jgi:hypothetical protein